jgi:hypothetical protein
LEKREVMDASMVQGLGLLAFSAYQTAQQMQHVQAATQTALAQYYSDSASYAAGNGATFTQVNQDLMTLLQDANNIQNLNASFQMDNQFFIQGMMSSMGQLSPDDSGSLFVDSYFLGKGQALANSAMQTAAEASSVSPSTWNSQQMIFTWSPFTFSVGSLNLQMNGFQILVSSPPGDGNTTDNINAMVNEIKAQVAVLVQTFDQWLASMEGNPASSSNPASS